MSKEIRNVNVAVKRVTDFSRVHGYIFTPQRKNVLIYLLNADSFIEAEDLWLMMIKDQIKISLPSVYAAMRWFTKNGFVEQQHNDQQRQVYQYKP